jgi:YHS domain-containing protein
VKLLLVGSLAAFVVYGATLAPPTAAEGRTAPKPADCLTTDPKTAVASTEYGGKVYYFTGPACKDEFLADPERYSQLYDALIELQAEGKMPNAKPRDEASLVPS